MMVGAAGTSLSLTRQREWKDGGQFWKFCVRRDLEDTNDARELRNEQLVFGAGSLTLSACRASGAAYVIFSVPVVPASALLMLQMWTQVKES